MPDEIIEKLARVDNGVATVNRLVIEAMSTLSSLPKTLDDFIRNPDDDNATEIEKTYLSCTSALEGIRNYLSQVASDVLGVENESDVNGEIDVPAVDDGEGVRLK